MKLKGQSFEEAKLPNTLFESICKPFQQLLENPFCHSMEQVRIYDHKLIFKAGDFFFRELRQMRKNNQNGKNSTEKPTSDCMHFPLLEKR